MKLTISCAFVVVWYKSSVTGYSDVYISSTSFLICFQLISVSLVSIPVFSNSYCLSLLEELVFSELTSDSLNLSDLPELSSELFEFLDVLESSLSDSSFFILLDEMA